MKNERRGRGDEKVERRAAGTERKVTEEKRRKIAEKRKKEWRKEGNCLVLNLAMWQGLGTGKKRS